MGVALALGLGLGLRLDLHEEEAPEVAVVALAHCVAQQVAVVVELGDDTARLLGILHGHGASTGEASRLADRRVWGSKGGHSPWRVWAGAYPRPHRSR